MKFTVIYVFYTTQSSHKFKILTYLDLFNLQVVAIHSAYMCRRTDDIYK